MDSFSKADELSKKAKEMQSHVDILDASDEYSFDDMFDDIIDDPEI